MNHLKSVINNIKNSNLENKILLEGFDMGSTSLLFSIFMKRFLKKKLNQELMSRSDSGNSGRRCVQYRGLNTGKYLKELGDISNRNIKLGYKSFFHIFSRTFLVTFNIFGHCGYAVDSFNESLQKKGGIWVKDNLGKVFYIKIDQLEKTTLNINDEGFGDLCDLHFWYCIHPIHQKTTKEGWKIVELPCSANFKSIDITNNNNREDGRTNDGIYEFKRLIEKVKDICPI